MKAGKYFEDPSANLSKLHRESFEGKRKSQGDHQRVSKRSYHSSSRRPMSSVAVDEAVEEASGVLTVEPPCSVGNVVHSLTDYVGMDYKLCQITSLPDGVDLKEYVAGGSIPLLDRTVPHAPKRLTRLEGAEEHELAIRNSLKYFHSSLHEQLRPVAEFELETYGHIYFYPLLPPDHVWAIPYDDIPGATIESKAMTHMILNVLDPRYVLRLLYATYYFDHIYAVTNETYKRFLMYCSVAQFPQELITYGGNGAVFQNWAQFHITIRLLATMNERQTLRYKIECTILLSLPVH